MENGGGGYKNFNKLQISQKICGVEENDTKTDPTIIAHRGSTEKGILEKLHKVLEL